MAQAQKPELGRKDSKKGILKPSGHYEDSKNKHEEGITWDEMNVLATYHPAGKDYGHMKVDEPDTPYSRLIDPDDEVDEEGNDGTSHHSESEEDKKLDPDVLAARLAAGTSKPITYYRVDRDSDDEEEGPVTEEARELKRKFESQRKMHYNEAANMKLAKQWIEQEEEELSKQEEEEREESKREEESKQEDADDTADSKHDEQQGMKTLEN